MSEREALERTIRDVIENARRDVQLLDGRDFDPAPFEQAMEALAALAAAPSAREGSSVPIEEYDRLLGEFNRLQAEVRMDEAAAPSDTGGRCRCEPNRRCWGLPNCRRAAPSDTPEGQKTDSGTLADSLSSEHDASAGEAGEVAAVTISLAAIREWAEQTPEFGNAGDVNTRIAPSAALALVDAVEVSMDAVLTSCCDTDICPDPLRGVCAHGGGRCVRIAALAALSRFTFKEEAATQDGASTDSPEPVGEHPNDSLAGAPEGLREAAEAWRAVRERCEEYRESAGIPVTADDYARLAAVIEAEADAADNLIAALASASTGETT